MIILILEIGFLICQCLGHGPVVETPLGRIQGYHKTNFNGTKFSAFEGVPFALPPIGERRFEEPQPIQPWYGTWNATFTYVCAQSWHRNPVNLTSGFIVKGDEDCLYLNVYVPRDQPHRNENLDVIVHIHGGAFTMGDSTFYAHPDYFMEREVIFVTMNYRLGAFGFLSTEDDVIPGNNGLKDQVMALKWIQENIASFGGNPDSVTLTGLSAGAASVHLHYFSHLSRGLFNRGLSQSGCALNPWVLKKNPLAKAQRLADLLGCPRGSNRVLAACLKQKSDREILFQIRHLADTPLASILLFGPVVEKGSKPFLRKHPYNLLEHGKVLDVPWITSTVSQEGLGFTRALFRDNLTQINEKWSELAPHWLFFSEHFPEPLWNAVTKKINDFYLGIDQKITSDNLDNFSQILTDRLFVVDASEAAKLQSSVTNSPVYYYEFSYPQPPRTKVVHSEDLKYFFYIKSENLTEDNIKMKDFMVDMLVTYSKSGQPIIDGVEWEPTKGDQLTFLNISSFKTEEIQQLTVDQEFGFEKFWTSLGLGHEILKTNGVDLPQTNFI